MQLWISMELLLKLFLKAELAHLKLTSVLWRAWEAFFKTLVNAMTGQ